MNNTDLDKLLSKVSKQFTPEYFEELTKKCYIDDREYPENFSNWYNHIINFGNFKHADIISNQIFTLEDIKVMQETDNINKVNWNKINEILKPSLDKMDSNKLYNIKNGCYSNKFDFNTSIASKDNLAEQLWKINYQSTMYDTGGYTELVIRDLIYSDPREIPTIYNGMPLQEEIRVFYNMDLKQIEYIVDYWDYDYCNQSITNKTDNIIFNWFHNKIPGRNINHQETIRILEGQIKRDIDTLKFDNELKGIWSIDFMSKINHDNCSYDLYLIDMARGERSAYWDPTKLTNKEV